MKTKYIVKDITIVEREGCDDREEELLLLAFVKSIQHMPVFVRESWIQIKDLRNAALKPVEEFLFTLERAKPNGSVWRGIFSTTEKTMEIRAKRLKDYSQLSAKPSGGKHARI